MCKEASGKGVQTIELDGFDGCMFDSGLDCFSLMMTGGAEYESKETISHAYHVLQAWLGFPGLNTCSSLALVGAVPWQGDGLPDDAGRRDVLAEWGQSLLQTAGLRDVMGGCC